MERAEQPREPQREQHTDASPEPAEDDAFSQELADETSPPGTNRQADGNLALTGRRARQQHAGDVRARDDEHESDREHRAANEPRDHAVRFGMEPGIGGWPDGDPPVLVRLRMFAAKPRDDDFHGGTRLLDRRIAGVSRALANSHRCPRRSIRDDPVGDGTVSLMPAGSTSSTKRTGTQISGASIGTMPLNESSSTPTIVNSCPRMRSVRPTALGSPPNSRCQYRFDNTTVRGASGASSDARSVRPRRAETPSVEK